MRLRLKISGQSLNRGAHLISNTVLLATNLYLVGSGLRQQSHARAQQTTISNLQTAAEIAGAIAGLTQIVTSTLDKYHAQDR
ncbi:MAG: hypothetical protein IIA60_13035 [Candidatus Marinimicrobia bacterium]|nr:hypothetical protein [Candidatus Neomarinimicrobiota bacterium]